MSDPSHRAGSRGRWTQPDVEEASPRGWGRIGSENGKCRGDDAHCGGEIFWTERGKSRDRIERATLLRTSVSRCRGRLEFAASRAKSGGGVSSLGADASQPRLQRGMWPTFHKPKRRVPGRMTSEAFMLRVPPRTMAMHGAGGPWCACMEVRTCFRGWWVCRPSHAERPARSSSKGLARRAVETPSGKGKSHDSLQACTEASFRSGLDTAPVFLTQPSCSTGELR